MSGISSALGDIVRSIQRGTTSITVGNSSATQSITSVNINKAALYITNDSNTAADSKDYMVRGTITDSTTLTFNRVGTGAGITVTWRVLEYY